VEVARVADVDAEHNLVFILARGLASSIATPLFLVDPEGTLVYYNEPAEAILGQSYAESGALKRDEWGTVFKPEDPETGQSLDVKDLPLSKALTERAPAHGRMRITGLDGEKRSIAVTGIPLFARTDDLVGALAIFWQEQHAG
jgi:PAS domain-containing protein